MFVNNDTRTFRSDCTDMFIDINTLFLRDELNILSKWHAFAGNPLSGAVCTNCFEKCTYVFANINAPKRPRKTVNADLEPKTHHQTPMTYGYSHFIHFKTIATEMEIQFLNTYIMFLSLLPQFWSAFSVQRRGCLNTFVHIVHQVCSWQLITSKISAYFLFLLDFFAIAPVLTAPTEVCSGCETRGELETTGVFYFSSFWWFVHSVFCSDCQRNVTSKPCTGAASTEIFSASSSTGSFWRVSSGFRLQFSFCRAGTVLWFFTSSAFISWVENFQWSISCAACKCCPKQRKGLIPFETDAVNYLKANSHRTDKRQPTPTN